MRARICGISGQDGAYPADHASTHGLYGYGQLARRAGLVVFQPFALRI